MILTGPEIVQAQRAGDISIEPFANSEANPNSYNFRLAQDLICLSPVPPGAVSRRDAIIPPSGYLLMPGNLYLRATRERIASRRYAITLLGRSSIGRLGIFLNATADLGHVGSSSHWTLEISVVQPVRVFANMRIGQVAFWCSEAGSVYVGRYLHDTKPEISKDGALLFGVKETAHDLVG
ncbi:MAG: deoxycytidine deaminase [Alphaproteobacteria bacterium]|nr:deoxycytidine deaminase [Alphaproteobacteria bacterium]